MPWGSARERDRLLQYLFGLVYTVEIDPRSSLQPEPKKIENSEFCEGDFHLLTTVFIWDISTGTRNMKVVNTLAEERHKNHFP
jgi:hypothetical protein